MVDALSLILRSASSSPEKLYTYVWEVWYRVGGAFEKGYFRVIYVYFIRGSLLVMMLRWDDVMML